MLVELPLLTEGCLSSGSNAVVSTGTDAAWCEPEGHRITAGEQAWWGTCQCGEQASPAQTAGSEAGC